MARPSWYRWQPTTSGTSAFDLCCESQANVAVYSGPAAAPSYSNLVQVAAPRTFGAGSSFGVSAGTTYYIQVLSGVDTPGSF